MSDIFISYAKEDRERARVLAEALEELGWSVWWDRIIPTGMVFADVIKKELDAAGCVVVLWSANSVTSSWVQREAREAIEQSKLFPALIEDVLPPWEFKELQACDLKDSAGKHESENLPQLVSDMGRILGAPPEQVQEEKRRVEATADSEIKERRNAASKAGKKATEEERHAEARGKNGAVENPDRPAEEEARAKKLGLLASSGKQARWVRGAAGVVVLVVALVSGRWLWLNATDVIVGRRQEPEASNQAVQEITQQEGIASIRSRYEAGVNGFLIRPSAEPGYPAILLDILVRHHSFERLPGITVDLAQVDVESNEKARWMVWLDTSTVERGKPTQYTHMIESVDYVEGDSFTAEVRPLPEGERAEYREFKTLP